MSAFKSWGELSPRARETMIWLGQFSPTANVANREIKGYMIGPDGDAGKTYLSPMELREAAEDFIEVAKWLDERAEAAP